MSSLIHKAASRLPDLSHVPSVDAVGVDERTARFRTRSIKTASKGEALRLALSMIDLTTLEGQDTAGKVRQLCYKGRCVNDPKPAKPECAVDGDCADGVCINSYCHPSCKTSADCGTAELCQGGVCQPDYFPAK